MKETNPKKSLLVTLIIPAAVSVAFAILNLFGFYRLFEDKVYDSLLHIRPPVPENKSILMLDIDDTAIANAGLFPWPRNYMAEGLLVMKEFGAKYALFDIEYVDKSPLGIDSTFLENDIPRLIQSEFDSINTNTNDLFGALQKGNLSIRDAGSQVTDLESLNTQAGNTILDSIKLIARDNDEYLGEAARFFGKTFFTVNMLPDKSGTASPELRKYVEENIAIKNAKRDGAYSLRAKDMRPAIFPIITKAAGAGFPNVYTDGDGVLRRINLITELDGKYYAQLAFSPTLDMLGKPEVAIGSGRILLKGALIPGTNKPVDISLPLGDDDFFLLNWPHKEYGDSFRHLSFYELLDFKKTEDDLVSDLKVLKDSGYLAYYKKGTKEEGTLPDIYDNARDLGEEILHGGDIAKTDEYVKQKKRFYEETGTFLSGNPDKALIADIEKALASGKLTRELRKRYSDAKDDIPSKFDATRSVFARISTTRKTLAESLSGAICLTGWTGTSTTDIGTTAFSKEYYNVGMHATIINSILNRAFLDYLPWWAGALIALVLSLLVAYIIRNMQPLLAIISGLGCVVGIFVLGSAYFYFTGVYPNVLTPTLAVFFSFIIQTFVLFLRTAKEKSFIRNAFSRYLSADVINELVADPSKLELGGEARHMTAMFTDIKGFSTISEILDPSAIVKLLNHYLTEMSNIIMSLQGTIDKYEGDAIISFFGAPIAFDDHAHKACFSAIKMKRMERILNDHILAEKLSPQPLFTRIGINTGEMVVGNMGTSQKMDYTIMGSSVNLASRLEGVNKQYGTAIIASESAYEEAKEGIFTRKLDRVRVVGINKPVRLYEIIEENSMATPEMREGVEIYHNGHALFEKRDWDGARQLFIEAMRLMPGDGPSEAFIKRCEEYKKKPPADSWDGVFNLSMK